MIEQDWEIRGVKMVGNLSPLFTVECYDGNGVLVKKMPLHPSFQPKVHVKFRETERSKRKG